MSPLVERAAVALRALQAEVLRHSGATRRGLEGRSGTTAVLMYHRVLRDDEDATGIEPGMFVRRSTFERQMGWLKERFSIAPLGQILELPPAESDRPAAVVTFDDGWRDNLTEAWPVLERHGIRPTIFLVKDWCSGAARGRPEFLTPDEIRELSVRGVEFGAHTATHPDLRRLGRAEAETEMRSSQRAVEEWTGRPCEVFAYPFGSHEPETADLARGIFRASVAVGGGWWKRESDLARIPRIGIHQDMSSSRALFEHRLAAAA